MSKYNIPNDDGVDWFNRALANDFGDRFFSSSSTPTQALGSKKRLEFPLFCRPLKPDWAKSKFNQRVSHFKHKTLDSNSGERRTIMKENREVYACDVSDPIFNDPSFDLEKVRFIVPHLL